MGEGLNQPSRVPDEGLMGRRRLLRGDSGGDASPCEGTPRIRIGQLRASSRGNTEDPSVIRNHWV